MPRSGTANGVPRPMCAPTTHFLAQQIVRPNHPYLSPNYLRQPTHSMAHCPLPDWEREAGGPELLSIIMSRMARIQWTQCVILGQLPNVIPAMRQLWLSRSVKKGCCYAEGEDITSHPSNTIELAPNTAKLMSNSMNKTTLHMAPRVSNITVCTALASL